jgi:hypothetical protein
VDEIILAKKRELRENTTRYRRWRWKHNPLKETLPESGILSLCYVVTLSAYSLIRWLKFTQLVTKSVRRGPLELHTTFIHGV